MSGKSPTNGEEKKSSEAAIGTRSRAAAAAAKGSPSSSDHHSLSHAFSTYLAHDADEQTHWEDVCRSYRQYATFAMAQWANHQYRLHGLPEEQRRFLPPGLRRESVEFQQRAKLYKEAAIRNQFCLDCILRHAGQANSQDVIQQGRHKQADRQHSTDSQMSKVSSVLKSLARDWSAEGKAEREMAYTPILEQVQKYLPVPRERQEDHPSEVPSRAMADQTSSAKTAGSQTGLKQQLGQPASARSSPPRLCVPGAGVARLACELAALGYAVQGNEFSLYMLLASDFILNSGVGTSTSSLKISPYLLESRNVHAAADPLRPVFIPDADPYQMIMATTPSPPPEIQDRRQSSTDDSDTTITMEVSSSASSTPPSSCNRDEGQPADQEQPADFSMAGGEFASIYGNARERGRWDGFVACFFLDTAPCIIEYITVMHQALKAGGFVFHFGPLLWHWSGPAMRPDDKSWDAYRSRYSYLDPKYMTSMDLAWQDVRAIFVNVGFEIVFEKVGVPAMYTADPRSMMNMAYNCIQFVAMKRGGRAVAPQPEKSGVAAETGREAHTVPGVPTSASAPSSSDGGPLGHPRHENNKANDSDSSEKSRMGVISL